MDIIYFLLPLGFIGGGAAAIIFLFLFIVRKVNGSEHANKMGKYILVSVGVSFLSFLFTGLIWSNTCVGYGCAPKVVSTLSCPSAVRKYVDERHLEAVKLNNCRSKEISVTDGRKGELIELSGDCIMGGDVCSSVKSYSALYLDGKFYDVPLPWGIPHIPGSHSICNTDAGGGAFRYDTESKGAHRELEITASGIMRYRYTLTDYDGGYGQLYGDEGGYVCSRTGVMTADVEGKNVVVEKPFVLKVTRLPMYCAKPQSYEVERCCSAQANALADDPTAPTYSYCR